MNGYFAVLAVTIIPTYLAFRWSQRDDRSKFGWTITCFVFSYFGLIAYVLTRPGPPSVEQYAKANPGNAAGGMSCNRCGSRSIRVWREQAFIKVRQYHICNHCGTTLYRSR
ncbi:MAG: hypothetical protein CL858_16185 [Cupriavidus sp.]|nr:PLDc N-terminal domain-containing protein [Cupriavidus pauculus]EKZ97085.1 hypothetical protein D769_21909 [Cupriavidus sp. HMR-1]MBU66973.1 hypothetical protein [Cupriavidus sp.]MCA3774678.1 PLDc N-terminal domain-containing protein [Cutibacterium sp.]QWE98303.1 PLDc N-terminal domain-containing protein [Cupriavidus sp. EM10]MCA3193889.1 PLDc N-terminal domain-containing protein [Cupriavidus sp.]